MQRTSKRSTVRVAHHAAGGFSFVSFLVALVIVAVMYFGYFRMASTSGEKSVGIQSLDAAKGVACRTQRQQIERDVSLYTANHEQPPGSLADLERAGVLIPSCPEGGRYALAGSHVTCSRHNYN
jgi:competence protein ComGC